MSHGRGYAAGCDPTMGAALAAERGEAARRLAVPGVLVRKLTAAEREKIRKHVDLEARKRAVRAGAKINLDPRDDSPTLCGARTEAGGPCPNRVQEGRLVCGVHRRQLAA